jgi:hypothetical protein
MNCAVPPACGDTHIHQHYLKKGDPHAHPEAIDYRIDQR